MVAQRHFGRALKHLAYAGWMTRRAFPRATLDRIEAAIRESERTHRAELRFAVEGALHPIALARGLSPRQRAIQVFSQLRVWDTEENCGVLIYVQLVDRCIEIVADRGISARVAQHEWDAICRRMETAFRERRFDDGALHGIAEITALLARHFAAREGGRNELPDKPVILP
jgi:uncharacterized membrane protein